MVAEFDSLAVGGNRLEWYRTALTDLPQNYPAVKTLIFFDAKDDQTVTYQKLDWSIENDQTLKSAVAFAIKGWNPLHASGVTQ